MVLSGFMTFEVHFTTLPLIMKGGLLLNEALVQVWSLGTAENDFVESPPPPPKKKMEVLIFWENLRLAFVRSCPIKNDLEGKTRS